MERCAPKTLKAPSECSDLDKKEPTESVESEQISLSLLAPDHPLLQKFQNLLKEHLLRTKEQLCNEIDEMKYQIKLKEQEREQQGAKLYDLQQEIEYQTEQKDEYERAIKEHVANRQQEEQQVTQLKVEYVEKQSLSKQQKVLYNKRMTELEHMQQLENNIQKWTYDMEDEVKNAKRVLSRDAQLQQQLSEDKKKSDLMFFHLNMEVKKKENELNIVADELQEMRQVISVLNTSIACANTDLEVLQNEHSRLNQAWNEVIVAISHRDKIMHQAQESIEKEKESIKVSTSGIESTKKQISKELTLNEKLESFKSRLANDFTTLSRDCQKEADTLSALANKLEELPHWLKHMEQDLQEAKREGNAMETEVNRIQWKIDKQSNKKFQLEEDILRLAQEQLITDKASEYRFKLLRDAQDQRRIMELTLAQSQNVLSETLLEIEHLKGRLCKMGQDNDNIKCQLSETESEYDNILTDLKLIETQLQLKLKRIDKLSNQLDELLRSNEGLELSPTELKIKQLEKVMHGAEQQIRQHQQFWLMLQNHFVNLSQKRNNQLNEIQITHKQLSIIKQKSLKIDTDLEITEATTQELSRDIHVLTSKLELLNAKLFKKRKQHESEESECELEHFQLLQRLKDAEMQVLALEGEIDELQIDIEHYKDLVLDKHRESLSWETKYKLIEETIHWRKKENCLDSEVGAMKNEIHRMQIRYKQLKSAQEKLMQDLEHCVIHREKIFVTASIKQRMESKPKCSKAASTAPQKVTELSNKLKQLEKEIKFLKDDRLINMNHQLGVIHLTIQQLHTDLDHESMQDEQVRKEIEECILRKHQNLEAIVHKQNRAKSYRKLTATSRPLRAPRSETTIAAQTKKQNETNDSLMEAVQVLLTENPNKKIYFTKLLQILKT